MVDWLHCNVCFTQPGAGANFSLTNCGHIYCEKCLAEGCKERCKMCGASCTTIRLSANMKPEVEMFFTDPVDIIRKCLKQAPQVLDFQKNHRRRMLSYLKDKLSKQKEVIGKQQEVIGKAHQSITQYQHVEREVIRLREENSYLKRLISEKGLGNHPRPGSNPGGARPTTPGSSPGSYRASPTRSPSHSTPPYHLRGVGGAMSNPSQHQTASSQLQSVTMTSPMAAGRISIRTPPSGGRIGSSQCTPIQDMQRSTPLSVPHPITLPSPSPKRHYLGF